MEYAKLILDDIITYTYDDIDEYTVCRYLNYQLNFIGKELKSKNGECSMEGEISIYNLSRKPKDIWITLIHEMAHHIDIIKRGTTDHKQEFYDIMQQLLFTALDMGILDESDILLYSGSTTVKKIKNMLSEYEKRPILYKKEFMVIKVYNAYKVKNILKKAGYTYNPEAKAWEFICNKAVLNAELDALHDLIGLKNVEVISYYDRCLEVKAKIIVRGNTYLSKAELKSVGMQFDSKNKQWYKFIKATEYEMMVNLILDNCEKINENQIYLEYVKNK